MEKSKPDAYPIYNKFPDKSEISGIIAAGFPFICNMTNTSSRTVNGQLVSFQQTDFIAIVAGIIAVGIALSTIRLWSNTNPDDLMKRRLLFIGILALGIFQVIRGLGILTVVQK